MYSEWSKINLVYEGEFVDDQRNGWGRLETTKGYYEGYFKNGFFEGEGKFLFKNGQSKIGYWKDGVFVGEMQPKDSN